MTSQTPVPGGLSDIIWWPTVVAREGYRLADVPDTASPAAAIDTETVTKPLAVDAAAEPAIQKTRIPEPQERNIQGSHLAADLDPDSLRKRVELAGRALAKYEFDSIAFRGVSGTILGAPIALLMNKEMVLVRKDGDDTHSYYGVEGNKNVRRYIIVDDFVSTGATAEAIISKIKEFAPAAECLGLLQTRYVYEDEVLANERRDDYFPLRKFDD
jgi:hypothetical protein